jgi:hypothetical protein
MYSFQWCLVYLGLTPPYKLGYALLFLRPSRRRDAKKPENSIQSNPDIPTEATLDDRVGPSVAVGPELSFCCFRSDELLPSPNCLTQSGIGETDSEIRGRIFQHTYKMKRKSGQKEPKHVSEQSGERRRTSETNGQCPWLPFLNSFNTSILHPSMHHKWKTEDQRHNPLVR